MKVHIGQAKSDLLEKWVLSDKSDIFLRVKKVKLQYNVIVQYSVCMNSVQTSDTKQYKLKIFYKCYV